MLDLLSDFVLIMVFRITQSLFSVQSHATNIPRRAKHKLQLTGRVGCMEPSLDTTIPAAALINLE